MEETIFYSWESDLSNKTNRGFIEKALKNVIKTIRNDKSIQVEPVIDRDTQNVSGSPDIASTIFNKINLAKIFVADISIINKDSSERLTPNPNVLIELGYALKSLGNENVILIFNTNFGELSDLPFDLRMRRILTYNISDKTEKPSKERTLLEQKLKTGIISILETPILPTKTPILQAIENQEINRKKILRDALKKILENLTTQKDQFLNEDDSIEGLLNAIKSASKEISLFSQICSAVAMLNDQESILEIYKWFGQIVEKYNLPKGCSGSFDKRELEYFKFIGHELFVTLIGFLIYENQWETLKLILNEPIPISYLPHSQGANNIEWKDICEHLPLLINESNKRNRSSLQADILEEQHKNVETNKFLPFQDFISTDHFLWLIDILSPKENTDGRYSWRPWSFIYMTEPPRIIIDLEYKAKAQNMLMFFNIDNINELKKRLLERYHFLKTLASSRTHWHLTYGKDEINNIGTK